MSMSKEATFVLGALAGVTILKLVSAKKPPMVPTTVEHAEPPQLPADLTTPAVRVRKAPSKAIRA